MRRQTWVDSSERGTRASATGREVPMAERRTWVHSILLAAILALLVAVAPIAPQSSAAATPSPTTAPKTGTILITAACAR
jgi:hypothetical protein